MSRKKYHYILKMMKLAWEIACLVTSDITF